MEITLLNSEIIMIQSWIKKYGNPDLNADCTGIHNGIMHVLRKFKIEDKLLYQSPEQITFECRDEQINDLKNLIKINKVNALWNIGVASGVTWMLEMLGILDTNFANLK